MYTCKDDSDDDDDDSDQQVVEEVKDLQQEQLGNDDHDVAISDTQVTEELLMPGPDGSADESTKSDSGSDDEMELSQQNHLHKPHRDPIMGDRASGIEKKATVVDPTIVRKHVKRTLMKKQKSQRRQPPPPQGGNKKVRKQHSKRKQIPDCFDGF